MTVTKQKINQDRGHIVYPYHSYRDDSSDSSTAHTALFGAYDGHGERGELLADYTMHALCHKLHLHPNYNGGQSVPQDLGIDADNGRRRQQRKDYEKSEDVEIDIAKAFREVFCEIDDEIKSQARLRPFSSGSTACVVLLRGRKLWVANVGDSRAVLARRIDVSPNDKSNASAKPTTEPTYQAIDLSKDQNAYDEIERERILQSGGYITLPKDHELPARIWLDKECSKIGLAMTRSIGDHALKQVGVIPDPEVQEYELNPEDKFFIIATDGVWEFVSSAEAVSIVQKCLDKGMGASDACKELIQVAMDKWKEREGDYRDDITAIVVRLDGIWDYSRGDQS